MHAGWPETEVLLTSIIWKELKAYDYGTTVLLDFDFDEVNSLPEKANRELMLETKKWPFAKKLKFLKRQKIIGPSTYQLFEEGRKSRKKFTNSSTILLSEIWSFSVFALMSLHSFRWLSAIRIWSQNAS